MEGLPHFRSRSPKQGSIFRRSNSALCMDAIQLIESEVPILEATNYGELQGEFMFQQQCSPCSTFVRCLFCNKGYPLTSRHGLAEHYYSWHGLSVTRGRTEFFDDMVFLPIPADVERHTTENFTCTICAATLENVPSFCLHYFIGHKKDLRFFPQPAMVANYSKFHCSICGSSCRNFMTHCRHMDLAHGRMIYSCKYCMFCTTHPLELYTHMRCHKQCQNGLHFQCPGCSVYLRGTEVFIRHLRKEHATQIVRNSESPINLSAARKCIDDSLKQKTFMRTSETEWCCAHCLSAYDLHQDLMAHLSYCPVLGGSFETKKLQFPPASHGESCKCTDCAEQSLLEQEIKKLRLDSPHVTTTHQVTNSMVLNKGDGDKDTKGAVIPGEVKHCSGGTAEASSKSLTEKMEAIVKEGTVTFVHDSSHPDGGMDIACGGCLMYFASENQFAEHYCTEKAF